MTVANVLKETAGRMKAAIEALQQDLAGFRTGQASTALVERLKVNYYGSETPLNQMATLAAPEPRLITIRPWDKSAMQSIEKAIMASDLGLTPSNDGQIIRLPIPQLTEERREELTRLSSQRVEEARITLRNIRRDALHELDDLDLPEDDDYRAREQVQELTDKYVELAEEHGERKAKEIREV